MRLLAVSDVKGPQSKEEFIAFLAEMRADLKENPDSWENPTLGSFLEAMQAWTSDSRYLDHFPSDVIWHAFAALLSAAKVYE
jgi:hypothetical protein